MDTNLINSSTYGGKKIAPGDPLNPDYYRNMHITPTEFIVANDISWREGNVIKYVCRWKNKNGVEDLRKARTYIDQLIKAAGADV